MNAGRSRSRRTTCRASVPCATPWTKTVFPSRHGCRRPTISRIRLPRRHDGGGANFWLRFGRDVAVWFKYRGADPAKTGAFQINRGGASSRGGRCLISKRNRSSTRPTRARAAGRQCGMVKIFQPNAERIAKLGFASVAHVPVIFDSRQRYCREYNRYLRERAELDWRPSSTFSDRPGLARSRPSPKISATGSADASRRILRGKRPLMITCSSIRTNRTLALGRYPANLWRAAPPMEGRTTLPTS